MHRRFLSTLVGISLLTLPSASWAEDAPVGKNGLCITPNALKVIQALKVGWCYNWSSDRPEGLSPKVDFVPMVWGWNAESSPQQIEKLIADKKAGRISSMLGFNEPDGKLEYGGAPMSVDDALDHWPELMKVGARLGSPGAVNAEGQWMQDFMAGVEKRNLRVDFITVHWYSYPRASDLLAALERIHKMYNRPVWITEFAPTAWEAKTIEGNYIKPPMVEAFLKELIPGMQAAPYIERYAWFSAPPTEAHMGSSALFNEDGSLTECGKIYATLPTAIPSSDKADASKPTP